jgi:ankyrin repeat protein
MQTRVLLLTLCASGIVSAEKPAAESLFQALRNGDESEVRRLLHARVDANAQDSDGTPALMAATLYGSANMVKVLLDRGANPNVGNKAGATALVWAVPDPEKVKLLVTRGAEVNAHSENLNTTPFLIAASYPGSVELLRFLAGKGADLKARDKTGGSALTRALHYADVAAVRFLLENGCSLNEVPAVSFQRRYPALLAYLLPKIEQRGQGSLITAVVNDDPGLVQRLIDLGADVNSKVVTVYDATALMRAVAAEQTSAAVVKALLERGADPNAANSEGERPLDWAMYRADAAKIDVLKQHGAIPGNGPRQQSYPAPEGIDDPRTSLSRSVALLLPGAPVVFQKRACVSCHNQLMPAVVAAMARKKGIAVDEALDQKNLQQIRSRYRPLAEDAMQGTDGDGPATIRIGYVMMALSAAGEPLNNSNGSIHASAVWAADGG